MLVVARERQFKFNDVLIIFQRLLNNPYASQVDKYGGVH